MLESVVFDLCLSYATVPSIPECQRWMVEDDLELIADFVWSLNNVVIIAFYSRWWSERVSRQNTNRCLQVCCVYMNAVNCPNYMYTVSYPFNLMHFFLHTSRCTAILIYLDLSLHHSIEQENGTTCRALSLCLTWMLKIKYHLTVIFLALVYIYGYGSYFRRLFWWLEGEHSAMPSKKLFNEKGGYI